MLQTHSGEHLLCLSNGCLRVLAFTNLFIKLSESLGSNCLDDKDSHGIWGGTNSEKKTDNCTKLLNSNWSRLQDFANVRGSKCISLYSSSQAESRSREILEHLQEVLVAGRDLSDLAQYVKQLAQYVSSTRDFTVAMTSNQLLALREVFVCPICDGWYTILYKYISIHLS